jgi:shikimate 5-dehydrogenase
VLIAARNRADAESLAARSGAVLADERLAGGKVAQSTDVALRSDGTAAAPVDVVVNTTTWGETEASEAEPIGIDLAGAFGPGVRLFDLNNRIGALAIRALESGCIVASGAIMQRVTNAARAALLDCALL